MTTVSVHPPNTSVGDLVAARLARLRAALAAAPFDWVVAGTPANVAYASGYRSVQGDIMSTHGMAALVGTDDLWLVGPCADSAPALEAGIPDDRYVSYGRFFFESPDGGATPTTLVDQHATFVDALLAAARAAFRGGVTVGVDGGLRAGTREALAGVPSVDAVTDAVVWLCGVRAVKLPGEVERLERAARLAETGIDAALEAAVEGASEDDLARVVARAMAEGGGVPRFIVVTAGDRSALADARPTRRPWRTAELLRLDVGCLYDGYWSDIGRTAVLGEPDELQASRYAAILAGVDAQLDALRPGVTASQLFDVGVEAVEAHGLRPYRRHHCGHGIGSEIYEPPIISPASDDELAEGMALCLETPFYELSWGGMMVEDTVVVTADGYRMLSGSDRSLRVISP